jgi:hypothetical protein
LTLLAAANQYQWKRIQRANLHTNRQSNKLEQTVEASNIRKHGATIDFVLKMATNTTRYTQIFQAL